MAMSSSGAPASTSSAARPFQAVRGAYRLAIAFRWLALLAFGMAVLNAELGHAATYPALSRLTTATVVHPGDVTLVVFTPRLGAAPVETTMEPGSQGVILHIGERVPVRYDPAKPGEAPYNGPGGDDRYQSPDRGAIEVSVLALAAAIVGLLGWVNRLLGVRKAVIAGDKAQVEVTETLDHAAKNLQRRHTRVQHPGGGFDLEWRVVNDDQHTKGEVFLLGGFRYGSWLVIRRPDGRLVWPASRAQPVLDTDLLLRRLTSRYRDTGPVGAHYRLLAAYALIINQVNGLPLTTRRPPGPARDPSGGCSERLGRWCAPSLRRT